MSFPPLVIGGAVFNYQYSLEPQQLPVADILRTALSRPITAGIDTLPYYGPSEEIIGAALAELQVPRENYTLMTKVGRIQLDEFDYLPEWVRQLVTRLCQRLGTTYFDALFLHDVEFNSEDEIHAAIAELFRLKDEGVVKRVGVSGYPVEFLLKVAGYWHGQGRPLDVVQLYCNGCIQNTRLYDRAADFKALGVQHLFNSSILLMSLLRRQPTHSFHPAPDTLKKRVQEVADELYETTKEELATVATRYALSRTFSESSGVDSIVLGVSLVEELEVAVKQYQGLDKDQQGWEEQFEMVQKGLGDQMNVTWASGAIKGSDEE